MLRVLVVVFALLLAGCGQKERLSYDGKVFHARGVSGAEPADGWKSVLAVYASDADGAPPILGDYEKKGGTLTFTPSFKPSPEVTLRVVYRPTKSTIETLIVPGKASAQAGAKASVLEVYPTTGDWPANQLKFYIQFSAPMSKGVAWEHIRLLDEVGGPVAMPFVEIDQELWDAGQQRLTVLFDPGRIKRGLTDNMAEGPPLVPGRRYTLQIDDAWPDANGQPLAQTFEKPIRAVQDVRTPVDPANWRVKAPASPLEPLVIDFPRPLDNALARRAITVPGVDGSVAMPSGETRWIFTPAKPWPRGRHEIRIDGILEDLAGNRVGRLFDVDTSDPVQTRPPPASTSLWFTTTG